MRISKLLFSGVISFLVCAGLGSLPVLSQSSATSSTMTLYSPIKHRGEGLISCINFQTRGERVLDAPCDLKYGSLYLGEDKDWFLSPIEHSRSLVRDLGRLRWDDKFKIPVVAPLPPLKPGETRSVTIDTSGADGADGIDGVDGADGIDGVDGASAPGSSHPDSAPSGFPVRTNDTYNSPSLGTLAKQSRTKRHNGKPKIDPIITKAAAGHLYVIHVVDEVSDFYALFRVESLERGDNCTISWKLIPAPTPERSRRK